MSDYFNKDSKKPRGQHSDANPWQQDPFAAYDDPSINPSGTGTPLDNTEDAPSPYAPPRGANPDYSAWRRPGGVQNDAMHTEDAAAVPQEEAYPDFSQPAPRAEDDFGIVSTDAPAPARA